MNYAEVREKLTQKWASLSKAQKTALIVSVSAVIVAALLFLQWALRVEYTPLFTELELADASAIVEKLKELNVSYRLADEGRTVLVPKDQVYELRMQLASSGVLTTGGVGFEIFDQTRLGSTEWERRINYQRALQEELRRTIVQLKEVEQARVHLVLPEPSVFIEEERPASASIALKLKPLARLKPEQVKGIIYLVSSSVENLPPENVNIIDMNGNILSDPSLLDKDTSVTQQYLNRQELKRQFERDLERRVQQMLERILGQGKVVTMITSNLDFDQRKITKISYDDEGVVRSEQVIKETSKDAQGAKGEPGTASNIGTYPGMSSPEGESTHTKEETIRNYEVGQTEETVLYAPGEIRSLSAAVAVDGPLSEERVNQIKEMVAAAIGFNPERGDQITVMSMAFNDSFLEKTAAEMESAQEALQRQQRFQLAVILGATALALLFLLVFLLRRRKSAALRGQELDASIEEMLPIQDIHMEPATTEREEPDYRKRVGELIRAKPEEAAQLLQAWMSEE
ncbi:flagellar basal-body MS-ring/collar protein FliF [Calderihabitans maritimus]|uniref:Flagellar M-ring protein n=1 Tax=Calderihabitans maritimus TaxID=1246530 RepID=A0A1Z5HTP7_9FIRM|nr:flagellar basal-body MS-ring/collar protein FliF [Calderihabitans maritimus]GAW92916.1 flagellar MS-ring protein [Calderihabitans maritimus]